MNYYPSPNGLPPGFEDWTPKVDQVEVYARMVREELAAVWSLVPIPPFVPPTCPERFRKYLEPLSSETEPEPKPQPKPQPRGYSILFEGGRRWPSPEPDRVEDEECEKMSIENEREPETEIGVIYMGDWGVRRRTYEPEASPMPVEFARAEPAAFCREDFIEPANASRKRKAEDSEVEELEGLQADVEIEPAEVNEVPVVAGAKRQKYGHTNELGAFFKRPLEKLWGILGWK